MPAYNFQAQFVAAVENGTKRATIRPPRKYATQPGMTLYLYTGMRTKACRKLATAICTNVRPIVIDQTGITIEGSQLSEAEVQNLVQIDGFTNFAEFLQFFRKHYSLPTPELQLIEWTII